MQPFISGNQFVAEGQPWHQAPLLDPVNGAKRPTEKNAFYRTETDLSLEKQCMWQQPIKMTRGTRH